jgi:hypothetical protein
MHRTLKELLAPDHVKFFDAHWRLTGYKSTLADPIAHKTGISKEVLISPLSMFDISVAQRMSWAATRQATRAEDLSYALVGIFRINMPMQYGEGEEAFLRLQKEILRNTNDQTLFAWSPTTRYIEAMMQEKDQGYPGLPKLEARNYGSAYGVFASGSTCFRRCGGIKFLHPHAPNCQIMEINGALHMQMPLLHLFDHYFIGLLPCVMTDHLDCMVGILLEAWSIGNRFKRVQVHQDYSTFLVRASSAWKAKVEDVWIDDIGRATHLYEEQLSALRGSIILQRDTGEESFHILKYPDGATWHAKQATLHLPVNVPGVSEWTKMSLDVAPPEDASSLYIEVATRVLILEAGPDPQVRLLWSREDQINGQTQFDLSGPAFSRAVLVRPFAKVEAEVKARRIFNHVITELTFTVRRYSVVLGDPSLIKTLQHTTSFY